jgi:exopolyphosphatase/guanosine-5'-triphosphate,3'-diphosphate pyrophosphatase
MAVATSAMREAENGKELVNLFATYYNLKVDIISGRDEAEMLSKAIIPYLDEQNYIHIDVGGGSTELNLYKNKIRVSSQSFKVGSVRKLSSKDRKAIFKAMADWLKEHKSALNETITAIGTGGNINKLLKLSRQKSNKGISLTELKALKAYVNEFDYDKRINQLKMNPDRADVIIPAAEIYIEAMKLSGADQILVPGVGLKDGTLYTLFEKTTGEHISNIEFLELF